MAHEPRIRDDFEFAAVAKAHRVPPALAAALALIHAIALALLGHPLIALVGFLIMVPTDFVVHRAISAIFKEGHVDRRRFTSRIAWLGALRYCIILAGPVSACWTRAGVGEAIFLCLNVGAVLTAALTQSGYVIKIAAAAAAPPLILSVVGLAPFYGHPEGPGILIGLLIFVLVGLAALEGTAGFTREYDAMRKDRQRFIADLVEAKAAAEASRREAEAAVEAKSIFLSTLSHEIRTPLNGILGLTQITQNGRLAPDQRENLNAIGAAGALLQSILNDVLDAGKIEAGKMELAPVATDVPSLISDIARFWRGPAQAKGLTLEVSTPTSAPLAMIDPVRLQQILFNLISNAIKFTADGVVRIAMTLTEASDQGPRLAIDVADSGVGMSPDVQGRLFGQFNQADPTIAGRYGGSGLGLYVCKNLVTLMGGTIGVESRLNRGSTFRIEVPWVAADAPLESEAGLSSPLKILAVDDNPTNRRVVSLLLDALGHACHCEPSGEAALEILAIETFDLVLLDMRMPGLNGEQTLARIRRSDLQPEIPVVALTADTIGWDLEAARASGFDDYLAKPIDVAQLAKTVAEVQRHLLPIEKTTDRTSSTG
jgi:signal transduction histidine kinase/CheY-like chemotaxis protein